MELFFMLSAMLALIVPIAIGRVRCIRMTPRLLHLFKRIVSSKSLGERSLEAGAFSWAHAASSATLAYHTALARGTPMSTSRAIWRNR